MSGLGENQKTKRRPQKCDDSKDLAETRGKVTVFYLYPTQPTAGIHLTIRVRKFVLN